MTQMQKLSTHPVILVVKRNNSQRNVVLEPMQQTARLLGIEDRQENIRINNRTHKTIQMKMLQAAVEDPN